MTCARIATAISTDLAIAHLREHDVDVVVTDLALGAASGLALAAWVVANRPGVPVIVMTAFGSLDAAVGAIRGQTAARTMGHLTVAGQSRDEVRRAIESYSRLGVTQILALRGDPPGGGAFERHPEGLGNATDLVRLVRSMGDFSVGVAAFPDGHPDGDVDLDARILLDKQEAGAEFAVTQLFFDAQAYFSLVERFRSLGGTMPIVAGIMPVTVPSQIERFASLSGSRMPAWFEAELRAAADDKQRFRQVGLDLVTRLCDEVLQAGAPGLQFFTLNRSTATAEILGRLRAMPAAPNPGHGGGGNSRP